MTPEQENTLALLEAGKHVLVEIEVFNKLLVSAKMLQQNAESCAANHYGDDFNLHGMPGWLFDTAADIQAAQEEQQ